MTAYFRTVKTALEDPQHFTFQHGTGGKLYRVGFMAEWGPHFPVPEATEQSLVAYLNEIWCLRWLTILD